MIDYQVSYPDALDFGHFKIGMDGKLEQLSITGLSSGVGTSLGPHQIDVIGTLPDSVT